jgi:hypothetical protein
MESMIPEG